ncbi:EF-hand calcium-binding domain-containing protein 12 [Rhinophrynus dorsalis]
MANEVSLQDGQISEEDVLKKYQHRDLLKTHFFRTACRTFGPPKSMIRRIIAPSMEKVVSAADSDGMIHGVPSCCIKSESGSESMNHHKIAMVCRYGMISEYGSQRIQNQDTKSIMSCTEWISARKKLHAQIDSMGNLNKWLEGKSDLNELEKRAYYKILDKHAQSYLPNVPTENMVLGDKSQNAECQAQKSGKCRFARPTIQKPNLAVLGILDGYLHQRQMRLVDLYNQTDKRKRKKLSINDLIAVRKEAKLPISDQQFDSLIVSLSSKSPNSVDYQELSKAWHVWKTENRKESRSDITTKSEVSVPSLENVHKVAQSTVSDSSERVIRQESPPGYSESSGSQLLHVPPISMEESRPLSYEDMEEIGKHYRERNRRAKSNTRLLDWLEQCRVIRTGNMAVDSHSMPSTLGGDLEMGDLVDNFRMKSLQQYHKILKLCRDYGVSLSEKLLERALLHPGDKLIRASGQQLWIHQPGTDAFCRQYLLKADSSMKNSWGSQDLERSSRPGFHSTPSSVPYPHDTYVKRVKAKVRGRAEVRTETIDCWTTFEQFQEMTSNLKKRYPHRFLTSNDNDFWPGHLLDKLCIYLPKVTWRDTAPS